MSVSVPTSGLRYAIGALEFRVLREAEIRNAEELLYQVYFCEQGWLPHPDNPSSLEVSQKADGSYVLTDGFSSVACWFGAFHAGKLIGCFRVLPYPHQELARYIAMPDYFNHPQVSELNRLAVAKEWRNHRRVMLFLKRIAFDHAFALGHTAFVTATTPSPSDLFQRLGLRAFSLKFKYHSSDEEEVEILFGDTRAHDRFQTALYQMTDKYLKTNPHAGKNS